MDFVELNRCFVPLTKDQEPSLEVGRLWGRRIGGWLDWNDLRQRRRVVLLAEASSGKTEEFRNQATLLDRSGKPAFYLRIEEMADQGFGAALDKSAAEKFERWHKGLQDAWFFLDSVDEARLNRKSFDTALKRFASELDTSLERAYVFVSCRVSDWKGAEDRATISRWLPAWETAKVDSEESADDNALLDPIFGEKDRSRVKEDGTDKKPYELLVVQLASLSEDQYRKLAQKSGITNLEAFVSGISKNGLEAFTERPGDLLELAGYWISHGRFGSFLEMVEHSVARKLRERDPHRSDNQVLSAEKARVGAERLAAALTLGKSFTLKAPDADPDPRLATGAHDPAAILHEWNDAERNALLRRGVFAPATYGRIRFHHRATQEYLTAHWLHRLLQSVSARPEVWNLIFVDRYGVETVVPSLRPAVAWLCLWHSELRAETIRREPLVLLQHGDPASLPLDVRSHLLGVYAKKHAAGEISNSSLDHRALWMFADAALADAITRAWKTNTRNDFRFDLLRLIREGSIKGCLDIIRRVACDAKADDYHRIIALQAMEECDDKSGLKAVAKTLVTKAEQASARRAANFGLVLYPKYLSTDDLLAIVARSQPEPARSSNGFGWQLDNLYNAAPNAAAREQFIGGIASLCLSKPFVQDHQHLSKRYYELARHLYRIGVCEVKALGNRKPSVALVRFLMVIERADRYASLDSSDEKLSPLVRANSALNRALFWSDVAEQRENSRDTSENPIRYWQVYFPGRERLWDFSDADLPWLYRDLVQARLVDDRRIVLSAIVAVLQQAKRLDAELPRLRQIVRKVAALDADLAGYLTPPKEDSESRRWRLRNEKRKAEDAERQKADQASWLKFRKELRKDPAQLSNQENLTSWSAGIFRLKHLTYWLQCRTRANDARAPCEWRLLSEGFGRLVAESYRDGMRAVWRHVKPARPIREPNGVITTKWTTVLAFGGLSLEAAEDADAMSKLTEKEAKIAARHGCFSNQGYPEWIEPLTVSHPQSVLPVLKQQIAFEWNSPPGLHTAFLYRYSSETCLVQQPVQKILLEQFLANEADNTSALDRHLRIIRNLELDITERYESFRVSKQRFMKYAKTNDEFALRYLAILLFLEPDPAINILESWLAAPDPSVRSKRAQTTLAAYFDRSDPLARGALDKASVPALEKLLTLAYTYVHPQDDAAHEGSYTPNTRDHAEEARNAILSALLDRRGADAYRAMLRVSENSDFKISALRFRELARGKAERDAENPTWTAHEVLVFERSHVAPVKTGTDLLRLTLGILKDIALQLAEGDVTSRPLLERAKDEHEVQHWLVEQLNFRAKERFHAYREAEVALGDKPDVIVSSNTAPCEVAIEIKHGGKDWTARQLEDALRSQLAEDYLKPTTRRHGVLVVTHHKDRRWLSPINNKAMIFEAVIEWLSDIAKTIVQNKSGAIEVQCVGINAFLNPAQPRKVKARRRAKVH